MGKLVYSESKFLFCCVLSTLRHGRIYCKPDQLVKTSPLLGKKKVRVVWFLRSHGHASFVRDTKHKDIKTNMIKRNILKWLLGRLMASNSASINSM